MQARMNKIIRGSFVGTALGGFASLINLAFIARHTGVVPSDDELILPLSLLMLSASVGFTYGLMEWVPPTFVNPLQEKLEKARFTGSLPDFVKDPIYLDVKLEAVLTKTEKNSATYSISKHNYDSIMCNTKRCPISNLPLLGCIPNKNLDAAITEWVERIVKGSEAYFKSLHATNKTVTEKLPFAPLNRHDKKLINYSGLIPLPLWMLCCYSHTIMENPVTDPDTGETFDKKYFNDMKALNPALKEPLPNFALRDAIEDWMQFIQDYKQTQAQNQHVFFQPQEENQQGSTVAFAIK